MELRKGLALLVAVTALLAGCGGGGSTPEQEVQEVGERFATAVGTGDLRTVCRDLFSDSFRKSLEAPSLDIECEDLQGRGALGNPQLRGLFVGAVSVAGNEATVRFDNSPVYISLKQEPDNSWRIVKLEDGP